MEEQQLKPCPFCGGKAELGEAEYARTFFYAFCTSCFASIQSCKTTDEAIKQWNTRVEPKDKAIQFIQEVTADGWIQTNDSSHWRNVINHKIPVDLILTTNELYDMYFKDEI